VSSPRLRLRPSGFGFTFLLVLLFLLPVPDGWAQLQDVHITPRQQPQVSATAAVAPSPNSSIADSASLKLRSRPLVKDVDLVLVPVSVTDSWNRNVMGLRRENFTILQGGQSQPIRHFSRDDSPISLCIVFDTSKSMKGKMEKARQAVEEFVNAAGPGDEFSLISFSDHPSLLVDFDEPVDHVMEKLAMLEPAGRTALYDAIYMGVNEMKHASNPRRALVVISDGDDNRSRYTARESTEMVMESDLQVYTLGIYQGLFLFAGPEDTAGARFLQKLSDHSGGAAVILSDTSKVEGAARRLNLEMRNRYLLGYRPADVAHDGKWHSIKITLSPETATSTFHVAAKTGYYAPGE